MKHKFDVLVVGGGCIGASVLHALTLKGVRNIALIDQGRKSSSATASSGGMMRIFHENPRHTELALRAMTLLKNYRKTGELSTDVQGNGSLYFFHRKRLKQFEASLKLMDDAGCCFEVICPDSGRRDFPQFQWQDDDLAIYESTGRHLDPGQFTQELLNISQERGANLIDDQTVIKIAQEATHYEVLLMDECITANHVILAGGSAMLPLLRDLGIHLPFISKLVKSFASPSSEAFHPLPNYFDRETLEFARLGRHPKVITSGPKLSRLLLPIAGSVQEQTAPDCYAPDRQGFITTPDTYPNLTVVSGWGGTALKFALEIGRATVVHMQAPQDTYERRVQHDSITI